VYSVYENDIATLRARGGLATFQGHYFYLIEYFIISLFYYLNLYYYLSHVGPPSTCYRPSDTKKMEISPLSHSTMITFKLARGDLLFRLRMLLLHDFFVPSRSREEISPFDIPLIDYKIYILKSGRPGDGHVSSRRTSRLSKTDVMIENDIAKISS
jgi:hypothetical protein